MLWSYLSVTVLMIVGILLIFIILLQRGRGGGLAGAFGGAGGQSALGTKAGDVFTRITIGLAVVWVFFACISIYTMRAAANSRVSGLAGAPDDAALSPGEAPAGDEGGTAGGATGSPGESGTKRTPPPAAPEKADTTSGPALGNTPSDGKPAGGSAGNAGGSQTNTPPENKAPAGGENP